MVIFIYVLLFDRIWLLSFHVDLYKFHAVIRGEDVFPPSSSIFICISNHCKKSVAVACRPQSKIAPGCPGTLYPMAYYYLIRPLYWSVLYSAGWWLRFESNEMTSRSLLVSYRVLRIWILDAWTCGWLTDWHIVNKWTNSWLVVSIIDSLNSTFYSASVLPSSPTQVRRSAII